MKGGRAVTLLLAGLLVALALSVSVTSRARHGAALIAPQPAARETSRTRQPRPATGQRVAAPAPPPRFLTRSAPSEDAPVNPDDGWRASDLDVLQEGLAAAYRMGMEQAAAAFVHQTRLRCSLQLPDQPMDLEWEALQTFVPDGEGFAVLAQLQAAGAAPEAVPLLDCLKSALLGRLRFRLPAELNGPFKVREPNRMIIDPLVSAADIQANIAGLQQRLDSPGIDDSKRALIEQHLALWQCYARRGPQHRRQCLQELTSKV